MRRVLVICVLAQVLLAGLGAKIYLTQHNTLHANGRWVSTKTQLERGLMGSFAFITERQSLAGGVLNLGAWHGFQEVVHRRPVGELASIAFDFRLTKGGDIVALFDRDRTGGGSGVRFGTVARHPSALLGIAADGRFTRKKPLRPRTLEPDTWHRARLDFESGRVTIRLGDRDLGTFARSSGSGRFVGFRGGGHKPVLLDNVEIATSDGRRVLEDFDSPGSVVRLAAIISAVLIAVSVLLFLAISRATPGDARRIALGFLTANLTFLVIGGLLFVVVLLRAGAYPGAGKALQKAEEVFRKGTVDQVLADIRDRHPIRTRLELQSASTIRVLLLGTSQTWGAGARRENEIFVLRVEERLGARGDGRRFECINAGFSSLRAADLAPILEQDLLPLSPELVVINLATNDRSTRGGFAASVRKMAEAAANAGSRVVLVKEANDPGSMDRGQLARFAELDQVGAELGLPVINMHGHLAALQDTGFLWWDLVHLTSYGQGLVAEKLAEDFVHLGLLEP